MLRFASEQQRLNYITYAHNRAYEGFTPVAALARIRDGALGCPTPMRPYDPTPLRALHNCLRIFETPAGDFIAMSGNNGYCDRRVIPFWYASGASARLAYRALYAELRKREREHNWHTSYAEQAQAIDLLFLCMNWL